LQHTIYVNLPAYIKVYWETITPLSLDPSRQFLQALHSAGSQNDDAAFAGKEQRCLFPEPG
jgi:hypothetical protein